MPSTYTLRDADGVELGTFSSWAEASSFKHHTAPATITGPDATWTLDPTWQTWSVR